MSKDHQVVMQEVRSLLERGRADRALEVLNERGAHTPETMNARGVCLLRLGQALKAVEVYRNLAVVKDSIVLRSDVPQVFKTNFATALLLAQNVGGCLSALDELHDETNPTVIRLRAAIERWRRSLSLPKRIMFAMCGDVSGPPVTPDFLPGELTEAPSERRAA